MPLPDADLLLPEATDPTTLPKRLEEIAEVARLASLGHQKGPYAPVLQAIAAHPNTPPHLLADLVQRYPAGFAANPITPLLLLEQPDFFARMSCWALMQLLCQEQLPAPCAAVLTGHSHRGVAEAARMHISLASEASREEWRTDVVRSFTETHCRHPIQLLELWELGAAPFWVRDWLAGSGWDFLRRECLLGPLALDSPGLKGLRAAVQSATGSRDFTHLEYEYDPALSSQSLSHLANCGPWLRRAVARHPNTPPETLRQLADSAQDHVVRGYVARNPSAPLDLLRTLARDTDPVMRIAVARNPALPAELHVALSEDPDPRVRALIARRQVEAPPQCSPKTTTMNRSATRTAHDSGRPSFTDMPGETRQRIAAARDRRTESHLLAKLAFCGDMRVCLAVLANPATPLDLLKQIADAWGGDTADAEYFYTPSGRKVERSCVDVSHPSLVDVIQVRCRIASHPAVSVDLLRDLAEDKAPAVRRAARAAAQTRFPSDTELHRDLAAMARRRALDQARLSGEYSLARFLALTQLDTLNLQLDQIAFSGNWRDRLAAALNPGTPKSLLANLAMDGNRLVRAATLQRLQSLPAS